MRNLALIFAAGLFITSCSDNTIIDEPVIEEIVDDNSGEDNPSNVISIPRRDIVLTDIECTIQEQQMEFSLKFFNAAKKEFGNQNFVVSPYSVATALSMLTNGTSGNTASELKTVLYGNNCTLAQLNEFNRRITSEITTLDNISQFEISNAVFYQYDLNIKTPFLDNNKTFYNALIAPVNFNDASIGTTLNKWISDATHGLITSFPLYGEDCIHIDNAIYFKSSWTVPFDKKDTKDAPFYNYDGSKSTVKMMHGYYFANTIDDKFAILKLDYGNRAFSMYIAYSIDEKDISLNGIENILTTYNIKKRYTSPGIMMSGSGFIEIPKFEVKEDNQIDDILKKIGIKDLFGQNADLTEMFDLEKFGVAISHNCVLKVDESGSEGAALTDIGICSSPLGGTIYNPTSFTVDRPFVFWIAEKSTGTMLFMGQIVKM